KWIGMSDMSKTYYVCKYTPLELLAAYGAQCENLNMMPEGFERAESLAHSNLCGFGKAVLEAVLSGEVKELVLVNCCDTIRSVYDILEDRGDMDFLYMLDILHGDGGCSVERVAVQLTELAEAYAEYKGTTFDREKFFAAFAPVQRTHKPHIAVLGARMGQELFEMTEAAMPFPVVNESCVNNRSVGGVMISEMLPGESREISDMDFKNLMIWYAGELLHQLPCMRMIDDTGRKELYQDPSLKGIIYHTVKFCDFYSFEYADIRAHSDLPLLKIESDYTVQSSGQLLTRLEAFAESLDARKHRGKETGHSRKSGKQRQISADEALGMRRQNLKDVADNSDTIKQQENPEGKLQSEMKIQTEIQTGRAQSVGKGYYVGIDSGSTSTDVVILDSSRNIVSSVIMPTGAGARQGAERALEEALTRAGLTGEDLEAVVTTGYGRTAISQGDKSITEITCHARGAHFLDASVRTVIDIGGQDSKVIRLGEDGSVVNFVMNDKCAAGTGRFLEMMARTMEMSLDELSEVGMNYQEDITISSMCTVFAESEVVSLIAQNKHKDDIVHGLNKAVATKTISLVKRVGGEEHYMMTGGVAQNKGLVKTLEEKLGAKLVISEQAQLCGAIGAALYAVDGV
ncbi:MAG: acyl-CoA dehydratase activase, partial [Clostridiales bacterium]|nr:acyl-CoA dehydratase activase [Clostridiales bacterium]